MPHAEAMQPEALQSSATLRICSELVPPSTPDSSPLVRITRSPRSTSYSSSRRAKIERYSCSVLVASGHVEDHRIHAAIERDAAARGLVPRERVDREGPTRMRDIHSGVAPDSVSATMARTFR